MSTINLLICTLTGKIIQLNNINKNIKVGPYPSKHEYYDECEKISSIENFKQIIFQELQHPCDQQRLLYSGKELLDENTLDFYNIQNNDKIFLTLRLGGPTIFGCTEYTIPKNNSILMTQIDKIKYVWKNYKNYNLFINFMIDGFENLYGVIPCSSILSYGKFYFINNKKELILHPKSNEIIDDLNEIRIKIYNSKKDLIIEKKPVFDKYFNLTLKCDFTLEPDSYVIILYHPKNSFNTYLKCMEIKFMINEKENNQQINIEI